MPTDPKRVQAVFLAVAEQDAKDRVPLLDRECGSDAELRQRVDALLRSHDDPGSFLDQAAREPGPTFDHPITEKPGTVIGPYKLLQQIGEGGFGVVYMAEQTKPVRRKVALKIIKPGMDTKEVVARFEAERQALALMDHPNIAKVFDAGATDTGRPYFVMELVKGAQLTEYCDKNRLSGRDRLQIFVNVCRAIQHAHQKGVIHRDLKPSNIMVTLHDGKPVPKVIDFGVSKALSQQLTEKTLFTAFGQMVGTPAYMSPEQAEMSGLDIDTRSDIYSLGVLLYELLTGGTPFDSKWLRIAGYAEMQRIICEEDPPKPSTRLTTMGEESSVVSSNRGTDPKKLGQLVRGDLDWIVMKALDKDRNRRYGTANGFAADIGRFLSDEPVVACPPTAGYRFRKFARRNKAPMAVVTATTLALVIVAVGSLIAAGRFRSLARRNADLVVKANKSEAAATEARDQETVLRLEAQRQTQLATGALADAQQQRERAQESFTLARSAVDEFLNHVTKNELLTVPGFQPLREQLLSSAMDFYARFTQDEQNANELRVELAGAHYRIALIRSELGQKADATAANKKSIELFEQLRDGGNDSIEVRLGLAKCYAWTRRFDKTVALCRQILEGDAKHAETRSQLAKSYNSLAIAAKKEKDIEAALKHHQQALALRESLVQDFPDAPEYLAELGATVNNLGVLLRWQHKASEAFAMFERGVSYSAEAYQKAPQRILWGRWLCICLHNVADEQAKFGQQKSALQSYRRVVAIRRKLAFENPAVASLKDELYKAWLDLARQQREVGGPAAARRSLEEAQVVLENIQGDTPTQLFELAVVYGKLASSADGSTELGGEKDEDRQRFADLAMQTLRKAAKAGYRDTKTLRSHRDLALLHERDDFRQWISKLDGELKAEKLAVSKPDSDQQKLDDRTQAARILRELIGGGSSDVRHKRTLSGALHSVGELQAGLKQYTEAEQSLHEALRIREELLSEKTDDAYAALDVLATRQALGQVLCETNRYPRGHQLWQKVIAGLEEIPFDMRADASVEQAMARVEQRVCDGYGRLGLWPLASVHAVRNARRGRVTNLVWDARFASLLVSTDTLDSHREYCRHYDEFRRRSSSGAAANMLAHLVWASALVDQPGLPADDLIEFGQKAFSSRPDLFWFRFPLAIAQYRAGHHQDARQTLNGGGPPLDVSDDPTVLSAYFLQAMIVAAIGDSATAKNLLRKADMTYRQLCVASLGTGPSNIVSKTLLWWWELAYNQQLRREAWQKIHGEPAPKDPWQHLIQARGYRLIGEDESSEAELAAAVAAADGEPDVWIARAGLFEQWNDTERAKADWQRAADRAELSLASTPQDPGKLYSLSRSLYRSGRYPEALSRLNETIEQRGTGGRVWDWLFLAMTHHQLGHAEESRKWFDQATAVLDDAALDDATRPDPSNHVWADRLYLRQLRHEAEELIEKGN